MKLSLRHSVLLASCLFITAALHMNALGAPPEKGTDDATATTAKADTSDDAKPAAKKRGKRTRGNGVYARVDLLDGDGAAEM